MARAWLRLGFWLDASRALDKLDVPQECRERLTAQMATRVPFLAPEDYPGALEAQQRAARYHGQPVPTYEEGLPFVRPVSRAAA